MSALHRAMSRAAERYRPNDYIPVIAQDADTGIFLCNDGHIGVCYWGNPVNGADDTTAEMLKGAFSLPLPEGSFVQVSLFAMPDIDIPLGRYEARREMGIHRLQNATTKQGVEAYYKRRIEFMSKAREQSNLPSFGTKLLDRFVVITLKMPYKGEEADKVELELLSESGAKLAESLQACGLFTKRMTDKEYVRLAHRITHPFEPPKVDDVREDQPLYEQVFVPGEWIATHEDHLEFSDGTLNQILSVQRWPKENALHLMAFMIGDPQGANNQIKFPYHINLTMHYPAQHKKTSAVKTKAGMITYQAFGPLIKFVPKLGAKKQGMDIMVSAIDTGATVVEASLSVSVYAKEREPLSRQMAAMRTYLQAFQFAMGEEKLVMWPVFWNAFPMFPSAESIKNTFRFKTMAVEHATTFLPILGEWKGSSHQLKKDKGYAMLLQSRRGQIMSLDLRDSSTNANAVIFAESGAGKSFLTQAMVAEYLSMGAKVFTIDIGRSYYKLCKWLGGEFIEFNPDSSPCLNPFTHVKDIDDEVGLIQSIIEKMAAPEDGLEDYHRSRIEEAVKAVFGSKGNYSNITDVAQYMRSLEGDDNQRVRDIGDMLYRYTDHGSEGRWFNGTANLDLNKDFVCLELEALGPKPALQQIVLMQIIAAIQAEIYMSNDGRPRVVVIDESWNLLDDPMVARFMEHAFRRFRKYNASAIIVTQSIADLYQSASGKAIAANSAFKLIMKQTSETVETVEREGYLSLDPYSFQQMRTIHSVQGAYSEVMIYANESVGIARLVVDRFTQVLFSTSDPERSEIINAIEKGVNPVEAIESFIAKHG
ncbi:type IV secretion system protein TraC [Acidovorax sp. sif1233]|uniref:type IV secretion system protein TraC n=1 Tax=Acidovorax sp. sif1233 TaxID=2854792 RepID=UPI002102DC0D|nr:type IV secretion system protein TraC [Acidovorax sp. sif1233]